MSLPNFSASPSLTRWATKCRVPEFTPFPLGCTSSEPASLRNAWRPSGGLAWQVHFRQKQGKPNALKTYQFGLNGPSYSVALKGRAWISAENYQIVRLETDIVGPVPEIKLLAEHTEIEYGAVTFREGNVNLWLPQSAEVYSAWRGRQVRRRYSFKPHSLFELRTPLRSALE